MNSPSADDLLLVGRVARAHGNKGQVIVNPETDFPEERFAIGQVMRVEQDGHGEARAIRSVRFQQGRPIIALEGIDSMDAAEALAGADLKMPASAMAPLPAGTFYRHDLVGCEVRDAHGERIGMVRSVEGPLERSILTVEGPRGEVLIPLAERFCRRIDMAARLIEVDLPEGLRELNERR